MERRRTELDELRARRRKADQEHAGQLEKQTALQSQKEEAEKALDVVQKELVRTAFLCMTGQERYCRVHAQFISCIVTSPLFDYNPLVPCPTLDFLDLVMPRCFLTFLKRVICILMNLAYSR